MNAIAYYSSPIGLIKLEAVEGTLSALRFAEVLEDDATNEHLLTLSIQRLHAYFKGEVLQVEMPIAPKGTAFQQTVWRAVEEVPHGRTRTYEEIAIKCGSKNKIRAVANAIGKNPLPLLIPCHRIIGKNGNLTGYLGGLWRKQHLLDLEQLKIQPPLIPLIQTPSGQ